VLATALLDRLLHHAEAISISGKSYRMKNRLATGKTKGSGSREERKEGFSATGADPGAE
jgi:hypothetical protein